MFPEIVTRGATSTLAPDGALGIQYTGLIPPIVKAIQELNLKLEDLATTTSATSTDQSSFTTRFFASLFARLRNGSPTPRTASPTSSPVACTRRRFARRHQMGCKCARAPTSSPRSWQEQAPALRENKEHRRVRPDPILGEGRTPLRLPHHPTTNQPWMKKRVLPTLRVRGRLKERRQRRPHRRAPMRTPQPLPSPPR